MALIRPLPTLNAIWVRGPLGSVHAACLASMLRMGHRTILHTYDPPPDVPRGVEVADARALMPESSVVQYRRGGSYSLFSNLFRIRILEAGLGVYVDCDVFLVRPIEDDDYIFGLETDERINGAVLKFPANSAMLKAFLAIHTPNYIPPWLSRSRRIRYSLLRGLGLPRSIEKYDWGELGPRATTYFAHRCGVADRAQPTDVFYPVPFDRTALLTDPGVRLADIITPRTLGVHLYHEQLRRHLVNPVPETSPLGEMLASAGIPRAKSSPHAVSAD